MAAATESRAALVPVAPPTLRPATQADHAAVLALLAQAGLPTADLAAPARCEFVVACEGDALIGAVGLERHGEAGLLRSLVVAPAQRGHGVGAALVAAIESRATELRLASLTLLTQTAAPFFMARGWRPIARGDAPASVQRSHEFTTLCPASSDCLHKTIPQTA